MTMIDDVREFLERTRNDFASRFRADFGVFPKHPMNNFEKAPLCKRLVREELEETIEAINMATSLRGNDDANALAHLAKEISDGIYVLLFTALYYGIPLEEVWREVHGSNMAKCWPDGRFHHDEGAKVVKPPGWKKPDIRSIIERHMMEHRIDPKSGQPF